MLVFYCCSHFASIAVTSNFSHQTNSYNNTIELDVSSDLIIDIPSETVKGDDARAWHVTVPLIFATWSGSHSNILFKSLDSIVSLNSQASSTFVALDVNFPTIISVKEMPIRCSLNAFSPKTVKIKMLCYLLFKSAETHDIINAV